MIHAAELSKEQWQLWAEEHALPSYVGHQIYCWIWQKGCLDPACYSNISKTIRDVLTKSFYWQMPEITSRIEATDGTSKLLIKLHDGTLVEMVLMRNQDRSVLCVSSQRGCRMGCTFCQTAKLGIGKNLSSGEILLQLILANKILEEENTARVRNVVFMGMGEPLDNFDAVVKSCRIMIDPEGFGLSRSRVTISTCGLVPEIRKLGQVLPMRLAVSLHSADEKIRQEMMPIARRYPLEELKEALLEYPGPKGITLEYLMIAGKNDSLQDAKKLVRFIHGLKAKVNLIPMNPFPGLSWTSSSEEQIRQFQKYLADRSIPAPVRYSKGQEVSAGCGQLAAKEETELHTDPRILRRKRARKELPNLSP